MIIKKFAILTIILGLTLIMGCTGKQSFEDYFHKEMGEIKKEYKEYDDEVNYSYSLVHQEQNVVHQDDTIAVFTVNNLSGKQIFIAYFEQENGQWNWKQTRGAEWNTPVKWSSMNQVPYIYSGAISCFRYCTGVACLASLWLMMVIESNVIFNFPFYLIHISDIIRMESFRFEDARRNSAWRHSLQRPR